MIIAEITGGKPGERIGIPSIEADIERQLTEKLAEEFTFDNDPRIITALNLAALLDKSHERFKGQEAISTLDMAQFLTENGVILPPVKCGDKIYELISPKGKEPYFITAVVCAVHIADGSRNSCQHKRESYILAECPNTKYTKKYLLSKFGKTVFTSLEETMEAIKERTHDKT